MANDPLADAKKFLAESKDKFKPLTTDKTTPGSAAPAKASTPPSIGQELLEKKKMVDKARQGLESPSPNTNNSSNIAQSLKPVKMHDGGKVKEDGLHDLQKGEVVIPKDKVMKDKSGVIDGLMEAAEEKAEPKHGKKAEKKEEKAEKKSSAKHKRPKASSIQHHADGSHTLTFHHHPNEDGTPGEDVSHAVPDDAGMHAAMQSAMAGPEPEAGEAAVGAEGAGPATS